MPHSVPRQTYVEVACADVSPWQECFHLTIPTREFLQNFFLSHLCMHVTKFYVRVSLQQESVFAVLIIGFSFFHIGASLGPAQIPPSALGNAEGFIASCNIDELPGSPRVALPWAYTYGITTRSERGFPSVWSVLLVPVLCSARCKYTDPLHACAHHLDVLGQGSPLVSPNAWFTVV